jgi:hypothetical protein
VRESVHGINQTITDMDTIWQETAAAQRASTAKLTAFIAVLLVAIVLAGLPLLYATHDLGLMLLVPFAGLLVVNFIGWLFFEESLTGFVASVVFGVASSPRKYVLRAVRQGTVIAADASYVRWLQHWP